MSLEQLVRPFGAVNLIPSLRPFGPRGEATEIVCSFGGSGTRTVSWSFDGGGAVAQFEKEEKFKETGRESQQVKVENPDDPDQFVEFCQAKTVALHRDKKGGVKPPRISSYDTSGGYHGNDTGSSVTDRNYGFKYDKENKTCKPKKSEPKGCA